MLQQATGIYTGSVYKDFGLLKSGFPAEYVCNASVLVVKTHEVSDEYLIFHNNLNYIERFAFIIRFAADSANFYPLRAFGWAKR